MKNEQDVMERPELTFIPEVGELVKKHYIKAKVILEYGSGGSTVLASEMPGKTIYSVESSRVWTKMMRRWFEKEQPVSMPTMQHVNIGPTGKWGTEGFQRPDVILVDGLFRVACALTAMKCCTKKTTLLFDDYEGRKGYHGIEEFLKKEEVVGNMARFSVKKSALPRDQLTKIIGMFAQHF